MKKLLLIPLFLLLMGCPAYWTVGVTHPVYYDPFYYDGYYFHGATYGRHYIVRPVPPPIFYRPLRPPVYHYNPPIHSKPSVHYNSIMRPYNYNPPMRHR